MRQITPEQLPAISNALGALERADADGQDLSG